MSELLTFKEAKKELDAKKFENMFSVVFHRIHCFDHDDRDAVALVVYKDKLATDYQTNCQFMCEECLIHLIEGYWTGGGPSLSDVLRIIPMESLEDEL
jgi:hypothetical protein